MLGIIPAAGEGKRFGGIFKELLPYNGETLLERAIKCLKNGGCDKICVVSNNRKISSHAWYLRRAKNVFFVLQQNKGMWGAIEAALPYSQDENVFIMPDTIIPIDALQQIELHLSAFGLGVFETDEPWRFGTIVDDVIVNKSSAGSNLAWGIMEWSDDVSAFWESRKLLNYTQAINLAIKEYGYEVWPLDYYYDIASWDDYLKLLRRE